MTTLQQPCPCGSGELYDACCGRFHRGTEQPTTPEELMRSRYAAYAVGGDSGDAYVFRTWHPRTRPDDVTTDPGLEWTGLKILRAEDDVVEFAARYTFGGVERLLHETSRFERRGGRWVYVEAITLSTDA
ncbi:MAG: YchJ family metal-binding protein [Nocardioides sp.]